MSIKEAEFRRLCMGMFGSLRSRGLKVMDARKNGAREGSVSIAHPVLSCTLGSLSNGDGDGNDNGKKVIGLDWQNNNFVHASRFLYIS